MPSASPGASTPIESAQEILFMRMLRTEIEVSHPRSDASKRRIFGTH
jgi:hypothetical protein